MQGKSYSNSAVFLYFSSASAALTSLAVAVFASASFRLGFRARGYWASKRGKQR